jgi:hypothetical protein
MWCLAASRAKTSPPLEKVPDSTASEAASGLKCLGSLARFDLDSRSWKTHQFSLLGDLEPFSETWPRWGMMRGGECWELSTPVLRTSEKESGSWPTPTRNDAAGAGYQRANGNHYFTLPGAVGATKHLPPAMEEKRVKIWPTPQAHKTTESGEIVNADGTPWDGKSKPHSKTTGRPITTALADAVKMWPTPKASAAGPDLAKLQRSATGISLQTAVAMYPTPGANEDSYRLKGNSQQSNSLGAIARREALAESPESGGQLNPTWVEWLMGWPLGWTDCAASAMDKCRQWCASHGKF